MRNETKTTAHAMQPPARREIDGARRDASQSTSVSVSSNSSDSSDGWSDAPRVAGGQDEHTLDKKSVGAGERDCCTADTAGKRKNNRKQHSSGRKGIEGGRDVKESIQTESCPPKHKRSWLSTILTVVLYALVVYTIITSSMFSLTEKAPAPSTKEERASASRTEGNGVKATNGDRVTSSRSTSLRNTATKSMLAPLANPGDLVNITAVVYADDTMSLLTTPLQFLNVPLDEEALKQNMIWRETRVIDAEACWRRNCTVLLQLTWSLRDLRFTLPAPYPLVKRWPKPSVVPKRLFHQDTSTIATTRTESPPTNVTFAGLLQASKGNTDNSHTSSSSSSGNTSRAEFPRATRENTAIAEGIRTMGEGASPAFLQAELSPTAENMWWQPNVTLAALVDFSAPMREELKPFTPVVNMVGPTDSPSRSKSSGVSRANNDAHHSSRDVDARYGPAFIVHDFYVLREHHLEMNATSALMLPLSIELTSISPWKAAFYQQIELSFRQQKEMGLTSDTGVEEIKRMLMDANPYLLGTTMIVTLLHTVFSMLAMRHDVQFWKGRKDFRGLSLRTLLLQCYSETVIFLYLWQDPETSWAVFVPSGLGVLAEYWKVMQAISLVPSQSPSSSEGVYIPHTLSLGKHHEVEEPSDERAQSQTEANQKSHPPTKAAHLKESPTLPHKKQQGTPQNETSQNAELRDSPSPPAKTSDPRYFHSWWPSFGYKIQFGNPKDLKTKRHDDTAVRYLTYIMIPIMMGYTVYSALTHSFRGWLDFLLQTQVKFIYLFGFVTMLPQIFINYKLKSVGQLPWRTFVYKALNTVIDDFFSFIIPMPFLHRLACFRDDIVFVILLYQRWIYPVDQRRRFGEEEEEEEEEEDNNDHLHKETLKIDKVAGGFGEPQPEETSTHAPVVTKGLSPVEDKGREGKTEEEENKEGESEESFPEARIHEEEDDGEKGTRKIKNRRKRKLRATVEASGDVCAKS